MKTIVIDKNAQSRKLILNNLENIENVEILGEFDEFSSEINFKDVNLVIFDIDSKNSNEILEKISFLKAQYENLNFIATSYEINSVLVSKTLNLGVCDFLLKPIIQTVIENSIKKINYIKEKKAKTICVFSNKGGVGKTSIVTNLAWEIYEKTNDKICILDLSFNSEDVSTFLKIEQKFNLDYILSNLENSNEELLLSLIGKYKESKIYLLEAQEEIMPEIKYTPQEIAKIINSLKNIFDYIIIDTSSILNEINMSIFNNSDLIMLISSMNLASIKNTKKCCELFDKIGYNDDKIKLIINRFIENEEFNLNNLNKEIFAKIPNNYLTLIDAINVGQNVKEINPQSNIAKAYSKLAQDILEIDFSNLDSSNYNHGIFNLLKRMGEE